jgi:hypothetical protein
MAVVDVVNVAGDVVSQTELNDAIFNIPVKKACCTRLSLPSLPPNGRERHLLSADPMFGGVVTSFTGKKVPVGRERVTSSPRCFAAVA